MRECSGAPSPDYGAQSDTWNIIYNRYGANKQAAKLADRAQQVAAEIGAFTEWQASRVATMFGYNLARVEDLLPPSDQSAE